MQRRRLDAVLTADQAAGFEVFWREYPKKYCKQDARRAWSHVTVDYAVIMRAVRAQSVPGGPLDVMRFRYIPYPATWLNGGRWEDEAPAPQVNAEVAALEVWGLVRKAMARGLSWPAARAELPQLAVEVADIMGWATLCKSRSPEVVQAQFVRAYKAMMERGPVPPKEHLCPRPLTKPLNGCASGPEKSLPTKEERDEFLRKLRQTMAGIGHLPAGSLDPGSR